MTAWASLDLNPRSNFEIALGSDKELLKESLVKNRKKTSDRINESCPWDPAIIAFAEAKHLRQRKEREADNADCADLEERGRQAGSLSYGEGEGRARNGGQNQRQGSAYKER